MKDTKGMTTKEMIRKSRGAEAGLRRSFVPAGTHVRYELGASVPPDEARAALELARIAAGSLFGPGRVALEARGRLDRSARTLAVDASTEVGRALALIFGGYADREFGADAVRGRIVPGPLT